MAGKRGNPNIREVSKATQFKPGQSPNPGGRPKGVSISRLVRDALLQQSADGSGLTKAEKVAEKVVDLAAEGNMQAIPLVWRYMDGEPKQARELSLRELAEALAAELGLDPAALLIAFERDLGAA